MKRPDRVKAPPGRATATGTSGPIRIDAPEEAAVDKIAETISVVQGTQIPETIAPLPAKTLRPIQ